MACLLICFSHHHRLLSQPSSPCSPCSPCSTSLTLLTFQHLAHLPASLSSHLFSSLFARLASTFLPLLAQTSLYSLHRASFFSTVCIDTLPPFVTASTPALPITHTRFDSCTLLDVPSRPSHHHFLIVISLLAYLPHQNTGLPYLSILLPCCHPHFWLEPSIHQQTNHSLYSATLA